jgi:hypothetical protein
MAVIITYIRGGVAVFYAQNAPSVSSTVTTTAAVTGSFSHAVQLYEFSGAAQAGALDANAGAQNSSESPTTVNPGSLTTTATDLIFVAANPATTHGSGFTAGATNVVQYILNQAAGTVATAYGSTADLWASVAVALKVGGVTLTGVSAASGVNTLTPSASASGVPSGVSASTGTGSFIAGGAISIVNLTGVSATTATGVVSAGVAINYGNVVSGSSALPGTINTTYFYVRWIGWLTPLVSGVYTLGLNVQDGGDLYVGSQQIVSTLGATQVANSTAAYTQSKVIELRANVPYPLVVEWQHGTGSDYECQVLWTPPGGSVEVIPTTALSLTGRWWNGNSGQWYPNTWY